MSEKVVINKNGTKPEVKPNVPKPEIKTSNAGTAGDCLDKSGEAGDCCADGVYAFVSLVAGSRAFVGQLTLENGTTFDGWCVFNPTGKAMANAMMPGIIFYSHGVYVTDSKIIADALRAPLKARRPMMYHEYNSATDPEVTAYLKDAEGLCTIEGEMPCPNE